MTGDDCDGDGLGQRYNSDTYDSAQWLATEVIPVIDIAYDRGDIYDSYGL